MTPQVARISMIGAVLCAAACSHSSRDDGDGGFNFSNETDADTDADSDADSDTDPDSVTDPNGFTLMGGTLDIASGESAAKGLCIVALDPDPAITGGSPVELGDSTVKSNGNFIISGLEDTPGMGIMLQIEDCGGSTTVIPTATFIDPSVYEGASVGDIFSGLTACSIDDSYAESVDNSLDDAGYSGSIWEDGALAGFVLDKSQAPIDGAKISSSSASVYYQDANSSDGLFTSGGSLNTKTSAAAGAIFFIPEAPIFSYSASASGYSFDSALAGSFPETVTVVPFIAH